MPPFGSASCSTLPFKLIYFSFSRNLLFLKNYSGNVEELSLNFTVVNNDLGESQVNDECEK